jgi:hypothetical protein
MEIKELIALASVRSGKKKGELGREMGHTQEARMSLIATGRLKASTSEIAYLATMAKMNPIEVIAEIESQREPTLAKMWEGIRAQVQWHYS